MPTLNVASSVRKLFPDVAAAIEQYRKTKPDRDSRNLERRLANERVLYDQFMRKLLLLSKIEGHEDLLAGTKTILGRGGSTSLQNDLHHMEDFLKALEAEIHNASLRTEVLVKLRRKTNTSRTKFPKFALQKRVDELSRVNKRLATYLESQQIHLPLVNESPTTLDFKLSASQNHIEPVTCFRISGGACACACQQSFSNTTIYDANRSSGPTASPSTTSDGQQNVLSHISVQVRHTSGGTHATPRKSYETSSSGQNRVIKAINLQLNQSELPATAISIQDLIAHHIFDFEWAQRLELAFRLSSAVLLLSSSPWPTNSMKRHDLTISLADHKKGEAYDLFLAFDAQNGEKTIDLERSSKAMLAIVTRNPILSLLGMNLVELAFGRTLNDIRQQDASLSDLTGGSSDLLNLLAAKRLVNLGRIGEEFGANFEAVVSTCLNQQYRESKGKQIRDLDSEDPSFLESAALSILLPLYAEYRKLSGCHCDNLSPTPAEGVASDNQKKKSRSDEEGMARAVFQPRTQGQAIREETREADEAGAEPLIHLQHDPTLTSSVLGIATDEASERSNGNYLPVKMQDDTEDGIVAVGPALNEARNQADATTPGRLLFQSNHDVDDNASEGSYDTMTGTTDSAFIWLSDDTDALPSIPETHPLLRFKDVSFRILWKGFERWRARGYGASEGSGSIGQWEPSKKRARYQPAKEGIHKDKEDPASRGPQSASEKQQIEDGDALTFGCPFLKKDATTHHQCCGYVLRRIRDVKQHLWRKHQMPVYCRRCGDVFSDENALDSHSQNVDCNRRAFGKLEGVTQTQRQQLSKKPPPNQTWYDQWYGIFDILFPGHHERPKSPYIDSGLLSDVIKYQLFVTTEGPRILQNTLTDNGAWAWNLPNGETDRLAFQNRILEEGVRRIFYEWTSRGQLSVAERPTQNRGEVNVQADPETTATTTSDFNDRESPDVQASSSLAPSSYDDMSWASEDATAPDFFSVGEEDGSVGLTTFADTEEIHGIFASLDVRNHVRYQRG